MIRSIFFTITILTVFVSCNNEVDESKNDVNDSSYSKATDDNLQHVTTPTDIDKVNNQGGFNLRFFDVETGVKVIPKSVDIVNRNTNEKKVIEAGTIKENGTVSVSLDKGVYDVTVIANGFETMMTYFPIDGKILDVNFNLEPVNPNPKLSSNYTQGLLSKDKMLMVGYIVNAELGLPLKGVRVSTIDEIVETYSDEDGFYSIEIPLPSNVDEVDTRNTLLFEKKGYSTLLVSDFDMWSNGELTFPVRLHEGVGKDSTQILSSRAPAITIYKK